MLLAIEQGNTNTLFAVHDGKAWIAQWRSATESSRTADEYAVWLSQLLGMADLHLTGFDGCIISSVVPNFTIFKPTDYISNLQNTPWSVVGWNGFWTVVFILPFIAISYLLFRKQEVG